MARLLLVRHAETRWNEQGRYQGHSNIGLSPMGVEQAKRLRERLRGEKVSTIYASDLRRTMETTQILASTLGINIAPCPELRELDFGKLEGLTFNEAQRSYPWIEQRWLSHNPETDLEQVESLSQLTHRVSLFVPKLGGHGVTDTILIVSHGGPLRVLLCLLLGIDLERWWQFELKCASISVVETYPQGAVLSLLNDVCHLKGLGGE